MRERLAHRGPDGEGLWEGPGAAIGHRRLTIVDLSEGGAQPMATEDGRFVLAYNGELYNDEEVRRDLRAIGVSFRTSSDTETVLRALATWGAGGLRRCRGMYALSFLDASRRVAILARDPLGVKPLYYALIRGPGEERFAFASEVGAFGAIPGFELRADPFGVAAYLTTTRTTLRERTMLRGVSIVRPGQMVRVNYSGDAVAVSMEEAPEDGASGEPDVGLVVRQSVRAHLRSDVPVCAMLSGGLDSSIIVAEACAANTGARRLRTYCSGAKGAAAPGGDDFAFARMVAESFGCEHTEVPVTQESFARTWGEMVSRQRTPLSTPNEVAIFQVACALRADGHKVALSGEGADELFGGYDLALAQSAQFLSGEHPILKQHPRLCPGGFELRANAWLSPDAYADVLPPEFVRMVDPENALSDAFEREFRWCAERVGRVSTAQHASEALLAHLIFQQRVNLAGLLLRLDTATMLAGVEGRTPFADARVRALADALPLREKIDVATDGARAVGKTKIALRRAFAGVLPNGVVGREKASFPLPFQNWIGSSRRVLLECGALREFVREEAIQATAAQPSQYWHLAWPMANLAYWLDAIGAESRTRDSVAA